jgi:hypothetical protein
VNHTGPAGGVECCGEIRDNPASFVNAEPSIPAQPFAQALTGNLIHHIVEQSLSAAGGVNGHDIGVPQASDRPSFRQEPPRDGLVRRQLGMDNLDGNATVQGGVDREEHDTHSTTAELTLQPILGTQRRLQRAEEIESRIAHISSR